MLSCYLDSILALAILKGVCIGGSIAIVLALIVEVIVSIYENTNW